MRDLGLLLDDPSGVLGLSPDDRKTLQVKVAALAAALDACPPVTDVIQSRPPADDRLLTAKQAAERLQVTPRWLYRHAKRLPFVRMLGRRVMRFSERGMERYVRERGSGSL